MKRLFNKRDTPSKNSPSSLAQKEEKLPQPEILMMMPTTTPTQSKVDEDESMVTLHTSGNSARRPSSKSKRNQEPKTLEEQLAAAKQQIATEKAGKRKLFHSLVKLANELRRTRNEAHTLAARQKYESRTWYEGGMWRAPRVLPGIYGSVRSSRNLMAEQQQPPVVDLETPGSPSPYAAPGAVSSINPPRPARVREAISLSDLFFNLVIVTGFTRVGVSISQQGTIDLATFFYFAVFWSVWCKEASYSTRFDTTDLSAQMTVLVTCFAVLFASLSTGAPLETVDANRIMLMAAGVALLYSALHVRVLLSNHSATPEGIDVSTGSAASRTFQSLTRHVRHYAIYNIVVTALEATVWLAGVWLQPVDWEYRWVVFVVALLLGLRIPRAFLANDFHASCSKRGVLFILLLGFLLQSIVVVASAFFEYQTPTLEHYSFVGAACLMFFCIKLLYVEDSQTLAQDHALLVNRWAGFFFHVGQFALLLSTTVMGSGLNLLTHSYLAATATLPGPEKTLVCGGFSATLLSIFLIKSMHVKRVPTDRRNQALFIGAYVVQSVVLLIVVGVTGAMALGNVVGFFEYLMQTDIQLLYSLSAGALFVLLMSWLDEGVELTLYESAEDSRAFRVHPFGFWWCLRPEVSNDAIATELDSDYVGRRPRSLSILSPLLGSSMAERLKEEGDYDSMASLTKQTSA